MKYLLFTVLVCSFVVCLHGQEHVGPMVKHDGLKEDGKNVCYYMSTAYKMVNVSYQEDSLHTQYYKSCSWIGKCKVRSRKIVVKVTRYLMQSKMLPVKKLYCCTGWMRNDKNSSECLTPICGVACMNGGECVAPEKCKCKEGFTGQYCQLVNDDCKNPAKNDCEQLCIPLTPGHRCSCKVGWRLREDGKHCGDIDECSQKSPPCKCKVDDGVCKAKCHNLEGGYECKCGKGYHQTSAEECEDDNECYLHPGICDQICINKPGSYLCKCRDGYVIDKKTNKCVDFDECKHNNGGCSDKCINIVGSYICTCPHGFYLGKDKKTCILIKPTMTNIVICQSEVVGELNCGSYDEKIMVIDAMYGRLTKEYCQTGNYTQDLRCTSKESPLKYLMSACDNLASCVIFIEKKVFGDPCPQIEKYLQVTYECMK